MSDHLQPVAVKQRWLDEWGMSPEWVREAERTGRIVIVDEIPKET